MANKQIFNNTLIITGSVTASQGFYGDGSNVTGVISSSYATTSSYALFAVSSSHEITFEISSSHALRADEADSIAFGNITDKPTLISSSLQFDDLTSPFTGSFTGSFTGDGTNLTGVVHGTGSTNYLPIWEDSTTIISSSISSTVNPSGTVLTRFNNADRIIIDKNSSITSGDPAFNISQDGTSKVEFGWDDDGEGFGFMYNYSGEGLKFGTAGANPIMFLRPNSAEITGDVDVTGGITVNAGSNTTQALEATGSLNITGSLEISGSLNISGSLTINGTLILTGLPEFIEEVYNAAPIGTVFASGYNLYIKN